MRGNTPNSGVPPFLEHRMLASRPLTRHACDSGTRYSSMSMRCTSFYSGGYIGDNGHADTKTCFYDFLSHEVLYHLAFFLFDRVLRVRIIANGGPRYVLLFII